MHMSTNYGPNDNYFAIIKYLIVIIVLGSRPEVPRSRPGTKMKVP